MGLWFTAKYKVDGKASRRAVILQEPGEQLFNRFGHDSMLRPGRRLEEGGATRRAEGILTPMSIFISGLDSTAKLGLTRDLFTADLRDRPGWRLGWPLKERSGANRFYRPTQIYTGRFRRSWVAPGCPKCRGLAVNLACTGFRFGSLKRLC